MRRNAPRLRYLSLCVGVLLNERIALSIVSVPLGYETSVGGEGIGVVRSLVLELVLDVVKARVGLDTHGIVMGSIAFHGVTFHTHAVEVGARLDQLTLRALVCVLLAALIVKDLEASVAGHQETIVVVVVVVNYMNN